MSRSQLLLILNSSNMNLLNKKFYTQFMPILHRITVFKIQLASDQWSANYVPVKSKLQHPPRHTPGIWRLFLPGREDIWSPLIGGREFDLDFITDSTWVEKSWRRWRIRGRLVENQRSTQALFRIWSRGFIRSRQPAKTAAYFVSHRRLLSPVFVDLI